MTKNTYPDAAAEVPDATIELTERETEAAAEDAAEAADEAALVAALETEAGMDETLDTAAEEAELAGALDALVAADDAAEEAAAVEEPEAEAPRQAVFEEDWTVNWAVVAVVPVESWMENKRTVPAAWFTVHCTGLDVAELEISSIKFCALSSRRMSKGPVPPVQVTW